MTFDTPTPASEGDRLYVYGVVPAAPYAPTKAGVGGVSVEVVVPEEGPRAVVHRHHGGPFDGPDEEAKAWVLSHSEVIDEAWETLGTVLPVSFNVIVGPDGDDDAESRLCGWLERESGTLNDKLAALDGKVELRVEVSLDLEVFCAEDAEVARLREEAASRPAGVRRLLEKRMEKAKKGIVDRAADDYYPDWRARLARHCARIDEYRRPLADPGLVPVLTMACLTDRADIPAVGTVLTAIQEAEPAARIRFLGPWPAYSFADMEIGEPG